MVAPSVATGLYHSRTPEHQFEHQAPIPAIAYLTRLPATVVGFELTCRLPGQVMHLAGSIVMALVVLTVVGTFLSDILLVRIDPRIRYGPRSAA